MKNKKMICSIAILIIIILVAVTAILITNKNKEKIDNSDEEESKVNEEQSVENTVDNDVNIVTKNPIVTMKIKDYGIVKIELYPSIAPNTVANFINLIENGYYDGLIFHRIIPGFVVQGGDKEGTGYGRTELTIKGEFSKNGFNNTLKHDKGVISMARADYTYFGKIEEGYNSAFSQFFIMLENQRSLNGLYAAFGKVIEGMAIIDSLQNIEIGSNDRPINPPVIEKMTVDTFGVQYQEPERIPAFDIDSL